MPTIRTLIIATLVFCIVFSVCVILSFLIKNNETNIWMLKILNYTSSLHLIPGIFLAVVFIFYSFEFDFNIFGASICGALLIGYLIRFFWPVWQMTYLQSEKSPSLLIKIGYLYTNSTRTILTHIYLPLIANIVFPILLFLIIVIFKELNMSIFLTNYHTSTISSTLFNLFESGEFNLAAAFTTCLLALMFIIVFFINRLAVIKI